MQALPAGGLGLQRLLPLTLHLRPSGPGSRRKLGPNGRTAAPILFLAAFGLTGVPFTLAHLAFVPAIMAALPAALNRLLTFFAVLDAVVLFPLIWPIWLWRQPQSLLGRQPTCDVSLGLSRRTAMEFRHRQHDGINLALKLLDLPLIAMIWRSCPSLNL